MTITGPDARSAAPGQAVVDAAMLVLERMGLTPADLLAAPRPRPAAPTFAEYVPVGLPRDLAVATLAARLADLGHAQAVLTEPTRFEQASK